MAGITAWLRGHPLLALLGAALAGLTLVEKLLARFAEPIERDLALAILVVLFCGFAFLDAGRGIGAEIREARRVYTQSWVGKVAGLVLRRFGIPVLVLLVVGLLAGQRLALLTREAGAERPWRLCVILAPECRGQPVRLADGVGRPVLAWDEATDDLGGVFETGAQSDRAYRPATLRGETGACARPRPMPEGALKEGVCPREGGL